MTAGDMVLKVVSEVECTTFTGVLTESVICNQNKLSVLNLC